MSQVPKTCSKNKNRTNQFLRQIERNLRLEGFFVLPDINAKVMTSH